MYATPTYKQIFPLPEQAPQTFILSRRVSAVSKDGGRIFPAGAKFALRYAAFGGYSG